jgi:hypothetical protein
MVTGDRKWCNDMDGEQALSSIAMLGSGSQR